MSRRQLPRTTAAILDAATFLPGEIAVDTTNDELRYDGDGSTVGGIKVAKKSDVTALQALTANLGTTPISSAMTPVVQAASIAAAMELLDQGAFTATGGSAARNLADRCAERVNLKDFGATGDGSTDDTTAIQAWLAAITAGKVGYAPAGSYKFTAALSKAASRIAIVGDGAYQTVFKYAGASTTIDLLTIGDGTSGYNGVVLSAFRIMSDTLMTAGTALRLRKIGRSSLHQIVVDGQDGNGKLYHGLWFNEVDNVDCVDWDVLAQADGIRVNGGNDGRAGLMLHGGKVLHCAVGIRCGGDFGGLYIAQADVIENDINVVIDTTITATANREIFFDQTAALDSSRVGANLQISDTLATGSSIVHMDGTWVSAAAQDGILIDASVSMNLMFMGGVLKNSGRDGVRNASTSSIIVAAPSRCTTNAGYGINSTAVNANIYVDGAAGYWASNSSGNVNANVVISALIGQGGLSLLRFASGAVLNWNDGDVLLTHSANALAWTGATGGYSFDSKVSAAVSTGAIAHELSAAGIAYQQFYSSGAGSDLKYLRWGNDAGAYKWEKVNDAYNSTTTLATLDTNGVMDVLSSYEVAGVKVVGARGAAVADASGGATVDTEARTAINSLLARLRAHGLIAT